MTESILKELQKLPKSSHSYYGQGMKVDFTKITDGKSIDFISRYFANGGKSNTIAEIKNQFEGTYKYRATHSVMLYFMGIIFYNNKKIKHSIRNQFSQIGIKDFRYIWFLICLYHDYTSINESHYTMDNHCSIDFMDDNTVFSNESINGYYKYRLSENRLDHGIYGGYLLRKRLNENLDNAIYSANANRENNHFVSHR